MWNKMDINKHEMGVKQNGDQAAIKHKQNKPTQVKPTTNWV